MTADLVFSVSDFVAVFNQTLEYAYPSVSIVGELTNFRVSKNRWVYFDLKDELSSVKFFGTVYQLPGPLEEGMMVQVTGVPRLHNLYGFSVNVQAVQPVGEGSLKRAAALLQAKLEAEGLFDESRKRTLPYPPDRIGLITSGESAAYADFIKILNQRWVGAEVLLADVQVQGEASVSQIVSAIEYFNSHETPPDVLVVTRGGGSADDLAAFSTEQVTRAVAASRVPTLVAIGHEVDISLAELAADKRASTPSNAAELLVPDKSSQLQTIKEKTKYLLDLITHSHNQRLKDFQEAVSSLNQAIDTVFERHRTSLSQKIQLLKILSPDEALKRGYAVLQADGQAIKSIRLLNLGQTIDIRLQDGQAQANITKIDKSSST